MSKIAILHTSLGRFGGAERLALLHALFLRKKNVDVVVLWHGKFADKWINTLLSKSDIEIIVSKKYDPLKILTMWKPYLNDSDIILLHHHVEPILKFIITNKYKDKIIWYTGEPLRAVWEEYVSNLSHRITRLSAYYTSREYYGRLLSNIVFSTPLYELAILLVRSLDKLTINKLEYIITNSIFTKKVIEYLYNKKVYAHVYPGIWPEYYLNLSKFCKNNENNLLKQHNSRNEFTILSVGALIPMKNHISLVKAIALSKLKDKINVIIVGKGPLEKTIRNIAKRYEVNVKLLSQADDKDLVCLYIKSDVVIHLAIGEPFGLVPVEAALFRKTSIVTRYGGTREFVIHNKTGFVVNPFDIKRIAYYIDMLLESDSLRRKMGYEAYKRLMKAFTIERTTDLLYDLLRNVQVSKR